MTLRARFAPVYLVIALLFGVLPARAGQTWNGQNLYFGDAHWHSCLSQDARRDSSLDTRYASMLYEYGLDFSLESDHAEAASSSISGCAPYLPEIPPLIGVYGGEAIATAMKAAADYWSGQEYTTSAGPIKFVAFPGYEWAPDARCWQLQFTNSNADNNTPGHINYFFDRTTGWTFHDDVWEPGDGDADTCGFLSDLGFSHYTGSKDWVDEILGQLIHQRDDPDRDYDLMIQYNHPASSFDQGGSSDYLAKWYDFEHSGSQCSTAEGGTACAESQCEAVRRAYGVTSVEWYTNQEASIGSTERHTGESSGGCFVLGVRVPCSHDFDHIPERYLSSRGLREGYQLAFTGGSDSHNGTRYAPTGGFPGSRGAGSAALTVVRAAAPTREAIWDGLTRHHTYALSRFREIGPVHKGRVDFYSLDPLQFNTPRREHGMGEHVEAAYVGTTRSFTISAASETGTTGVYPVELRLYRVAPTTPLTTLTTPRTYWLDDLPDDPGKFGELLGIFRNTTGSPTLEHSWEVVVRPGDAVFAVVPYSDYDWVDDVYDTNKEKLDADGDGVVDDGKTGFVHGDNNTWARTTPIFFDVPKEWAHTTSACATVTMSGSGSEAPEDGGGGSDAGLTGDKAVLPVAIAGGYDVEWNRYRFTTSRDSQYVDLSFFTGKDGDDTGTLFGVRIDGRLVYSGRGGVDWPNDTLVTKRDIPFALGQGIHSVEIHSDDQEYANGDNDPDFHCNDYDGVAAFLDALSFHSQPGTPCNDHTPPVITCPAALTVECSATGGASAGDAAIAAFLAGATATDDLDTTPTITTDAPAFFNTGTTTVAFTAEDDAGNQATCTADVVIADTTPPQLAGFALAPPQIGPPRHDLKPIAVPAIVATDVCDSAPVIRCSVTSDEPPNGLGDGDTPVDIVFNGVNVTTQGTGAQLLATSGGQGTFTLSLRAERNGKGQGRTYTAACVASDAAGNAGTAQTSTVFVPRCASGKGRATGVCVGMDSLSRRGLPGGAPIPVASQ